MLNGSFSRNDIALFWMHEEWYRSYDQQGGIKRGIVLSPSSSTRLLRSYDEWASIILERCSAMLDHLHGDDRVAFERIIIKFMIDLPQLSDLVLDTHIKRHSGDNQG